ncbi:uncharacterized protein LOC106506286 isoform X2 [Sus scrofa]|uniref:uncharacterized protein LOC106506286 isoform X2 n=1 Tax=Sus scrofa TaxID=9823 RepID=UPI000A2AFD40|nr:uncharacterized protein LOC106506286 isoform X2 [Sus scrofa]
MRKLTVHRSLEDPFSTPGDGAPERAAWTFQTLRSIAAPSRHQQVNLRPEKPQGFPATAAKLSSSVSSNPFKKEPTWGSPCRSLREPDEGTISEHLLSLPSLLHVTPSPRATSAKDRGQQTSS